jgi:hypothetical protein
MEQHLVVSIPSSMRKIGWLTISSGIIGLVAIGFLIAAVE